ncbi:DNA polymerase III subunit alpha [Poriferisphaera sp. WC338]|uniref:DNA polymerase III subunit alpha n=1 Tax=Poriferisphaera sp. WC338 TaxID=3425129 RepID=UPI003D812670
MAEPKTTKFAHLHLHTMYSLLDGGNKPAALMKRVKELGMDAVAITDHGNLFGAADCYKKAKAEGIKPILGIEAYVAPDVTGKSDRTKREFTGVSDGGFHLVLLAENQQGWSNLLKLSSDAYINGFYFKPRMDKGTLTEHNQGLIAINGHLGSSLAFYLVKYEQTKDEAMYERAKEEALWHAKTFPPNENGEPCFFIELQSHEEKLQDQINPHLIRLAKELDLPLVCDNDAHFLTADDWDAHDTLCCISMGKIKHDDNRLHYPKDLYVKSPEEMHKRFVDELDLPEAIENTTKIADRCNVELDFEANHAPVVKIASSYDHLPTDSEGALKLIDAFECDHEPGTSAWYKAFCAQFKVEPYNTETDTESPEELKLQCDGALRMLSEAGAIWRYGPGGVDEDKRARMERELQVLADKLISAYFIIVWDFVNEARSRGMPSNARGSGVGTMVGYALGIANACPVKYGLLFERFTDPDRTEYPDIDIDICQNGRQEIIQYVRDKYGYVAQIITYGTLKARAVIRDVGRVHDMPLGDVDNLCKLIGDGLKTTLDSALEQEPDLKALYDSNALVKEVYDTGRHLEGMARHVGVHAAGVIVATQPLDNIVPLYKPAGTEQIVTQWDGPTCEAIGLLKMDFLGLRTLTIIERARQLTLKSLAPNTIRRTIDPDNQKSKSWDPLDLERLNFDDEKVLDLFRRGETAGVFQFESGGMRNLLMAMAPDRLEDLIAANALYRPGPMELIPNYNNRKHGREEVPKVHEIVDNLTAETYGIMVYQEQVMQVVNQLGSIPLRQAYTLIKAISKKKMKVIDANRAQFIEGAGEKGVTAKQAGDLFDLILKFAGYGFNKSHSTGYAIVAYQTAYLKTYFPIHYMAALLTFESVSTDKVVEYIDECKRVLLPNGKRGAEVKPPDINLSDVAFTVVYDKDEERTPSAGHIRFGLSAVKGVGEKAIHVIIAEREKSGPFRSLSDFCERVPSNAANKSTIEALIKCGAFDSVHSLAERAAMIAGLEAAMRVGSQASTLRASDDFLFGAVDEKERAEGKREDNFILPPTPTWEKREMLEHEKEVLGLYASSHPLDEVQDLIKRHANIAIENIKELAAETKVIIGGMLTRVRPTFTKKKGEKMAMITIESKADKIDGVAFPRTFETCSAYLQKDEIVFIEGKVDRRREEPNIIIEKVIPASEAQATLTRGIKIIIGDNTSPDNGTTFNGELTQLKELIRQAGQRGKPNASVTFELHQGGKVITLQNRSARITVDEHLTHGVTGILNRAQNGSARCELLGPTKLRVTAENTYDESQRDDENMIAMSSAVQGDETCGSVDRYNN